MGGSYVLKLMMSDKEEQAVMLTVSNALSVSLGMVILSLHVKGLLSKDEVLQMSARIQNLALNSCPTNPGFAEAFVKTIFTAALDAEV